MKSVMHVWLVAHVRLSALSALSAWGMASLKSMLISALTVVPAQASALSVLSQKLKKVPQAVHFENKVYKERRLYEMPFFFLFNPNPFFAFFRKSSSIFL